jgi:PAS domain S-box-containing protein
MPSFQNVINVNKHALLIDSAALGKKDCVHILHVDDDLCLLEVSKRILTLENNFEIDNATSVDEAFKKMEQQTYDAIISDYEMPQKNGLQFLQELRERHNFIPFIILTGKGREEVAIKALNYGADQYLDKTGDPETMYCELAHNIRIAVERKESKKAMLAEKDRLETVTRSIGAGLAIISKDYHTLWANEVLKQIFGDVEGKICYSTYNQKNGICSECGVHEIFENGKAKVVHEQVGKDVDQKTIWSEITATPIKDNDGNITAVLELVVPITQRKEAEAELRRMATIVTDSNDAITVVDIDGRIIAWNKGAEGTYGYLKDEALGMDVLKIVPEDKKQETLNVIGKIKANETVGSFETKRLAKDGRVLDVWLTTTKLVDDKGKAVALATTERDITEKKRLEERLRFSERFTILGQLASSVAHEIRNPLGVIKNSVYFLNVRLKEHADEKVVKHLKIMERNINSVDLIITDLLDIARNKLGVLEPVDLRIILERTFASLSVPENIKVITKLGKIPKMLLDPESIQRVFLNIIQNAVAAMPEGGKLIVDLSRIGDSVEISFKDSGVGISEENMQKLFTPLFTTKAKGLGLGLTICKQIVEGHHGDIEVKSKAGEGALFIVRLPILSRAELVKAGLLQVDVLTG